MQNEMIERVANAIAAVIGDGGVMTPRQLARAAIEAMRIPLPNVQRPMEASLLIAACDGKSAPADIEARVFNAWIAAALTPP